MIDAKELVEKLNEIALCDPCTIGKLIETRLPCNRALAEHPAVQVRASKVSSTSGKAELEDRFEVGLLGILNGLLPPEDDEIGLISAVYEKETNRFIRFELTPKVLAPPKVPALELPIAEPEEGLEP